jgi:Ser-tRNA(Ala) deacylase AlaX
VERSGSAESLNAVYLFAVAVAVAVKPCHYAVTKSKEKKMPELNPPTKDYNAPMHTTEHILNQTMIRMFNCGRSRNAHIERKKSKCDYFLPQAPTQDQITEIEKRVNEVISQNLPITDEIMSRQDAAKIVDLSKLPEQAGDTLRIVKVGDYDLCPCIGLHVSNTSEIGNFQIINYDFTDGRLRLRFKLIRQGEQNG